MESDEQKTHPQNQEPTAIRACRTNVSSGVLLSHATDFWEHFQPQRPLFYCLEVSNVQQASGVVLIVAFVV